MSATATYVAPGYKGSPTLELINAGDVPLAVRAGDPICHLVLIPAEPTAEEASEPSRYHCATRPYPSRNYLVELSGAGNYS